MLPQYVIPIGGSAGSLEALKTFFDHMPLNNASYIILRHLPIGYKSNLDLLLFKHSCLHVKEVKEGMPFENNKVYYAPPNHNIIIKDGCFGLIKRRENEDEPSIDLFLNSLAQNENVHTSIVVILSGIGKDGVKGVNHVKKAGGLVIVQSPISAEYPELPLNIIKTGNVDFVLFPEDMAVIIQTYIQRFLPDSKTKPF